MALLREKKARKGRKTEFDDPQKLFNAVFSMDDGDTGEEEEMTEDVHCSLLSSEKVWTFVKLSRTDLDIPCLLMKNTEDSSIILS
jgi:hypothetical protein